MKKEDFKKIVQVSIMREILDDVNKNASNLNTIYNN